MPSRKQNTHLFQLAKRGAEARLQDLVHEAKLLMNLFPHLRDSFDKDELPLSFIIAKASRVETRGRARKMSAAARKAVGARMTKYWAKRRRGK